ncbi:MAG: hypothetical protein ABSH48_26290, partial [Verrucomicrobiota bacterium]
TDDLFAYVVSDGRGGSSVGTITLQLITRNEIGITVNNQAGNGVHLTMAGTPGDTYQIQASTNVVNWVNLYSITADSLGMIQLQDPTATNQPKRFYRAKLQ